MFIPGASDLDDAEAAQFAMDQASGVQIDLDPPNIAAALLLTSEIARRYARGESIPSLSDALDLPPNVIKGRIAAALAEHRTAISIDVAVLKSRELLKIENLEREYWLAYEKSCLPEITDQEIEHVLADLDAAEDQLEGVAVTLQQIPKRITKTKRTFRPSTVYLQGVERCIKMRLELLEITAPPPLAPSVTVNINSGLTTDERIGKLSLLLSAAPQTVKDRINALLPAAVSAVAGNEVIIDADLAGQPGEVEED